MVCHAADPATCRTDGQTRTQVLFLVGALSELYLRAHERHATHETWKPPDTFMRRTTKVRPQRGVLSVNLPCCSPGMSVECQWRAALAGCDPIPPTTAQLWVRPERAVEVMCAIGKHLPVLVFGHRQGSALLPPHPLPSGPGRCPSTPDPSSIVQSVYLDSPGMHAYTDRLFRRHNASVLRIRWYGDHVPGPESQVTVLGGSRRCRCAPERSAHCAALDNIALSARGTA